jgi:hypothetical protein
MAEHSSNKPTEVKRLAEANYLLKSAKGLRGNLIGEIEVRSREQTHIKLGEYTEKEHLKGFVIEFTPEPQDEDGIVANISRLDKTNGIYELVLHIANYDTKTICAEIKQL